jgi:predicted cupin superfamily sugar epimerase
VTHRDNIFENARAQEIIELLELQPHPEGGHYRETFRDTRNRNDEGREACSAIYYLLRDGEFSHWHRVDAAEIWHWYAGGPLRLDLCNRQEGERSAHIDSFILGPDLKSGARPQLIVPAFYWQSVRPLGSFTLVGCTVAPAFLFSAFELAPKGFRPDA